MWFAFVIAFVGLVGCAGSGGSRGDEAAPLRREETQVVAFQARVKAVDLEKRLITLQDASGDEAVFHADEAVKNLPQVRVGDEVLGELAESVVLEVRPATPEEARSQRSQFDPAFASAEERQEACENSLNELRAKTIDTVNLDISVTGTAGTDFPYECSVDGDMWHAGRCWPQVTYLWKASALCHKPLYFEEVQLERYGHTAGPFRQPILSGAHFIKSLVTLPYHMGMSPPTECEYALGYYRPGNCAPWMIPPIPLSLQGAKWQIGAALGFSYLIP